MTTTIRAAITSLLALFIAAVPRVGFADPEPIKIGSILILTGQGGGWGNPSRNGIDMAIDKINAEGGVLGRPFTIAHQDDQGDPKKSIAAFRELTELRGVHFVVGPSWSNLGVAIKDLAGPSKTVLISPSIGVADFKESSNFVFSTWPHDTILSSDLARYVYSKGYRTVALVGTQQVWVKEQTAAFKEAFEKLGGKIPFITEPDMGTTDLKTDALRLSKTPGIEAVISTTDGIIIGSLLAKALRDLHSTLPFFSIALDQSAIDAAQGAFEGLEFLTFLTPSEEFQASYRARFHSEVDTGADTAYDAVMLLAQAMRNAKSVDPEAVAKSLAEIKTFEGASGNLSSDGRRGFTKAYAIEKVVGGKPVLLTRE